MHRSGLGKFDDSEFARSIGWHRPAAVSSLRFMAYPAVATAPTRARYWVIVFAITLAVIQFIDRVCISQTAPAIAADLRLSKEQMGWIFSAFTLAYALFEIPTGYWGDRRGPKGVLIRVVTWWSFFTAATGWVWSWSSLLAMRFLFGAGEAGCFPNLTKAFEAWLPRRERIRAQSVMWMSARWGGAITPYLVFLVLTLVSWRTAFMLFGLLGVVWVALFARWFRDDPRLHPSVNSAEAALLPVTAPSGGHLEKPWRLLLRSRAVWLLCGQYMACSYAWYFFITWFPTYLLEVHGFNVKQSALLAGLPLFAGGLGSMLAGVIMPRLEPRFAPGRARRMAGVTCSLGAGGCLVAAAILRQPLLAVTAIALASFCNDFILPGAWTTCMDIGGRYVATVAGTMNMMGNLGGVFSPIVLGYIVGRTGNWNLTFLLTAGFYALGALCWYLLDTVTPLARRSKND
jgi:MFS family permease